MDNHPKPKRLRYSTGCGILVIVVVALLACVTCSGIVNSMTRASQQRAIVSTPQAASTLPAVTQTANPILLTPTDTPIPTTVLPTPVPTQATLPTSVPTQPPVTIQPTQPPAPKPTQPPPVNGNPWGYSFTPGRLIYNPNPNFCDGQYFNCVSTFWSAANGYVVECVNGLYSHSGSIRGVCSHDGGVAATLYQN